jgi:hypothetical protein
MQLYKQPVDGEPGRSARDRSQHLYLTQTLEVRFGSLADVRHLDSELARKQTWDAPVTSDYVPQADIQPQPRRRPGYWTELCFINLPTIARNTSGLSLATFWNSASSEDSDAPGCFSIKSNISFSAASMVLHLSGVIISAFYRRRASTLCCELRLPAVNR